MADKFKMEARDVFLDLMQFSGKDGNGYLNQQKKVPDSIGQKFIHKIYPFYHATKLLTKNLLIVFSITDSSYQHASVLIK
jgi:hypothetical protein